MDASYGSPWAEGDTPGAFQQSGSGAPSGAVDWITGITGKPATATEHPTFAQVRAKPITLEGYGITDGVNTTDLAAEATTRLNADITEATMRVAGDAAVQAYSIQRGNHSGTQLASTIADFPDAHRLLHLGHLLEVDLYGRGDHSTIPDAIAAAVAGGAAAGNPWVISLGPGLHIGNFVAPGGIFLDAMGFGSVKVLGTGTFHSGSGMRGVDVQSPTSFVLHLIYDNANYGHFFFGCSLDTYLADIAGTVATIKMTGAPGTLQATSVLIASHVYARNNNATNNASGKAVCCHLRAGCTGYLESVGCHFKTSTPGARAMNELLWNESSSAQAGISIEGGHWQAFNNSVWVLLRNANNLTQGATLSLICSNYSFDTLPSIIDVNPVGSSFYLKSLPFMRLRSLDVANGISANGTAVVSATGALPAALTRLRHGGTAGAARPGGYAGVTWMGSVEPTNAVEGDVWEQYEGSSIPAFVNVQTAQVVTTTGTTLTIAKPAGLAEGHVMIAQIRYRASSLTLPAGWVLIGNANVTDGGLHTLAYKVVTSAGAEPASYDFVQGGDVGRMAGGIAAYSGASTTNPIGAATSAADSTLDLTVDVPAVTSLMPNSLILRFFGARGVTSLPAPSGTTRWAVANSTNGNQAITLADTAQAAEGTAAAQTATATGAASNRNNGWSVALNPVPVARRWLRTAAGWAQQ
jgi:hypothetical protein